MFSMEVMVHGHHKYQNVYYACVGETLRREREVDNILLNKNSSTKVSGVSQKQQCKWSHVTKNLISSKDHARL